MTNRDFVDKDLVRPRDDAGRLRMGPAAEPPPARLRGESPALEGPARQVSDLDLPVMARHKHKIDTQAAQNVEELERLRRRQEELERAKRELEDARRKQTDYEKGKQDLLDAIHQSLVVLERQEIRSSQIIEVLQATRQRSTAMQRDIASIREDEWTEATVRDEVAKALVRVDDARMEFNKSMARVEAMLGEEQKNVPENRAVVFQESSEGDERDRGFGHWVLVGAAVSLPLILTLAILTIVFLMRGAGLF
jgi:hypothetical protein